MIPRILEKIIAEKSGKKKAIIILGARQTGKTTLIKHFLKNTTRKSVYLNADKPVVREQLASASSDAVKEIAGNAGLVVIDEAQRVKDIGLTLKQVVDELPEIQIVVTGSSSFELASSMNEPLTGRKYEYMLYPVSWEELIEYRSPVEALSQLGQRIIYGMYPEVITHTGEEKEILLNLTESYLYKDILAFQQVRKPEFVHKLLQALAFQVGNEVSYNELSGMLQIDRKTIINYINILEKAFVIFRLSSFSRNLRNELSSKIKIYFYDTGVRNALINDFRPLTLRPDMGSLWENFIIAGKLKSNHYHRRFVNAYFWRTHQKQEIDFIEESDGVISAYEIKWNPEAKARIPKTFVKTYPNVQPEVIHSGNFTKFLVP